jgi:hypothetical protein
MPSLWAALSSLPVELEERATVAGGLEVPLVTAKTMAFGER